MTDFEKDGSIIIDDVRFDPVAIDEPDAITTDGLGIELDSVKFDVFNNDIKNPQFFGHLDIYFNGVGNWLFIDWKQEDNCWYIRKENQPMSVLFSNSVGSREDMILTIAKCAKKLHDSNSKLKLSKWKKVDRKLKRRNTVHNKNIKLHEDIETKVFPQINRRS